MSIRAGIYIGYDAIKNAKRVLNIGKLLGLIFSIIVIAIIVSCHNILPKMFSNNNDVIELSSKVIYYIIPLFISFTFYQTYSGLLQALGYQKFSAKISFLLQYIVGLGAQIILLFAFNFKEYNDLGLYVIWLSISIPYILCIFIIIFYLKCKQHKIWINAVKKSTSRIFSVNIDK